MNRASLDAYGQPCRAIEVAKPFPKPVILGTLIAYLETGVELNKAAFAEYNWQWIFLAGAPK